MGNLEELKKENAELDQKIKNQRKEEQPDIAYEGPASTEYVLNIQGATTSENIYEVANITKRINLAHTGLCSVEKITVNWTTNL